MEKGVPAENILPERQATFTYENAIYTRKLTDALGLTVQTALLSCQAYHARRALLYYQALFPETRILVTPTVTQGIRREDWFGRPKTIDLVLQEVEHCGSQFHEILKNIPNRPFRSAENLFFEEYP
ncbi:MAG: YdcF family protein [Lachnospiraceae bacterium]